jgi:periplasmic protein TonB
MKGGFIVSAHIQLAGVSPGRRSTIMFFNIALNALVIAGFMAIPISQIDREPVADRITVVDVPVDPQPVKPAVAKDPLERVTPTDWKMPPPEIPFASTDPDQPVALIDTPITTSEGAGTQVLVQQTTPDTTLRHEIVRSTDDYYPAQSIRAEEQGAAIVEVCVGADGRIASNPTVARSSGYRRLDGAAVVWAREALRFQPATREGVAVPACKSFRVNFTLH